MRLIQPVDRLGLIGRVILLLQLTQPQTRSIVHGDFDGSTRTVVHIDLFKDRDKANVLQRFLVVFHVLVGFGRAFVIIESHAG